MMHGYNFTERIRRILAYAREEAARLAAPFTDTDHILLGLIREREGVGAFVLEQLACDLSALRDDLEKTMPRIEDVATSTADLPYTAQAKRVLEQSMASARELSHNYVGSEHLLLGMLRDGRSTGARLLAERGITFARAHSALLRVLGAPDAPGEDPAANPHAIAVEIELQMSDGTTNRQRFTSLREAVRFLALHRLQ
jgi:ATP-dependent Clp protease ATP-binding subunit ClpC